MHQSPSWQKSALASQFASTQHPIFQSTVAMQTGERCLDWRAQYLEKALTCYLSCLMKAL